MRVISGGKKQINRIKTHLIITPFFNTNGLSGLDATRLPEYFAPVNIIQRGADHALAGGGVNEGIVGVIDAHVQAIFAAAGFKKYQITGQQIAFIDARADISLINR